MTPDLHMHTTGSDGVLSPRELVALAARSGVSIMAITDHDSLDGVDSLRGEPTDIPVLTGTELSIRDMRYLHLLGYSQGDAAGMRTVLHRLAEQRLHRARAMVQKLNGMGIRIDYDELCARCGGTVGRMHIARELLRLGCISHTQQAFDRYIGEDGPAYVEGERLSMAEALSLMQRSGFVPVLAHPAELRVDDQALQTLLKVWKDQGLMGVEVYHPSQHGRGYARLDAMVRRMGFLVTGGSDFHAPSDGKHGNPGCTAAYWPRAEADVEALQKALGHMENR
ncbi:MAG: PHP domain-containing protein [Clostridia bacterium]|nr:PHP domain-containing protein [Clostridia bacterium]